MNIFTLCENIKTVLLADSALATWLTNNYSATLNVYVGRDNRDPLGEGKCPYAFMHPEGRVFGDGVDEKEHVISLRLGITNDNSTTAATYIKLDGLEDIVDMTALVIDAMRSNLSTIGLDWMGPVKTKYESVDHFPHFFVDIEITFIEQTSLKGNLFN